MCFDSNLNFGGEKPEIVLQAIHPEHHLSLPHPDGLKVSCLYPDMREREREREREKMNEEEEGERTRTCIYIKPDKIPISFSTNSPL